MKQLWLVMVFFGLVGITAVACSSGQQTTAPQSVAGQPTATQAAVALPDLAQTLAPQIAQTLAPQPGATSVSAPTSSSADTLSIGSRDAGLDKLKSYRIRWQSQWTTTEVTKTQTSSWDWFEEFSSNPEALHWNWKFTEGAAANNSGLEAWQIGDTTYMVTADQTGTANCISFSTADASQHLGKGLFSPTLLGSLSNARFVGNDTANGIASKHYKYDEKSVTLGGIGKVAGEVWTAVDGGYVVKDVMQWQGGAGLFGLSATGQGSGKWDWELTDANQPITIKAPDNCQGAAADLPVMPDAQEKNRFGDALIYKSPSKMEDVIAFYKKAMPAAGWKAEGESTVTEGFATLNFTKDNNRAQVSVTTEGGVTNVIINVSKQ